MKYHISYPHTFLGFENLFNALDTELNRNVKSSFPPYNIIRYDDGSYAIDMAVAGYDEDNLEVTVHKNKLTVATKTQDDESSIDESQPEAMPKGYLHRGIANRSFSKTFTLAEHVEVNVVNYKNGILRIGLVKNIPEEDKPKVIPINGSRNETKDFLTE